MSMATPDLIIGGIILLSIIVGIIRGLVKESISLVTWIVAILLAVMYTSPLSKYITITKHEMVHTLIAFLLIFVGTVFLGAILNFVVGELVRKTPFSIPDRVLGSIFGLLRGFVFATILIMIGGLTTLPEEQWWHQSYAISRFQGFAIWLKEQLPEETAKVFHFSNEKENDNNKKADNIINKKALKDKHLKDR